MAIQGKNTREVLQERAAQSVQIAHHLGGWITTPIMAWMLWPAAGNRKKYAERLMAEMIARGWLLKRVLPNRMTAGVVTAAGAKMANESYALPPHSLLSTTKSGTDWGKTVSGKWSPPLSWKHQLRAGKFMAWISARQWQAPWRMGTILFDMQIQRCNPTMLKRPDGLFSLYVPDTDKTHTVWVEVESSRKTGPELTKLIAIFQDIQCKKAPPIHWEDEYLTRSETAASCALVVPGDFDEKALERRVQRRLVADETLSFTLYREEGEGFISRGMTCQA